MEHTYTGMLGSTDGWEHTGKGHFGQAHPAGWHLEKVLSFEARLDLDDLIQGHRTDFVANRPPYL